MDDEVKVLLVSSEGTPDALVAELKRLKVVVTECAFSESEEHLETDPPDLVALVGARGAIELANIIDDMATGPRMVIVAERKELAKLRGLNREVVVSLFAMETTEKVVGQRIESLARRAHRRAEQKAAPEAAAKKTALGLPSAAAAVGKMNLKKPPGAKRPPVTESTPPSSGGHPGAEPPTPEPPAAEAAVAQPAKPAAPPRAAEAAEVMDDELLESLRPDAPTVDVAQPDPAALVTENLPMMSLGPEDDEPAPVSNPPTLPPAAKAQAPTTSEKKDLSLKIDPGDLDLSSAEDALENLDSVKMELTEELVDHVTTGGPGAPAQEAATATEDEQAEDDFDESELESLRPDPPEGEQSAARDAESEMGMDKTMPLSAMDPPPELEEKIQAAAAAKEPPAEASAAVPAAEGESPFAPLPEPERVVESEAPAGLPRGRKGSGSGKGFGLIAALVVVGGGGFAAMQLGLLGGTEAPRETTQQTTKTAKNDDESTRAPSLDKGQEEPAKNEAALADGSPEAEEATKVSPEPNEPEASAPSTSALDNPFKMTDTEKPGCDELLANNVPEAGKDPVAEASQIWADARKAIVGGKKDKANILMCQAVALNPNSAAIEGLAHHYLSIGSYRQALKWVDKADAARPGQLEMGNLRGDIHGMLGDVSKAREVWLNTLNIRADERSRIGGVSKDYSVEAGRHLRRGDYVRAELFFRRAIILDPENLNGIIGLAKVYHRIEKPDYARAFCEMSLKVSDVIPEVHVLLGDLAQAQGNKDEARQRYERALAVRPGFFPAKRGLTEVK